MRSIVLASCLLGAVVAACSSTSSSDTCGAYFDAEVAYSQACSSSSTGKVKDRARFTQSCTIALAAPGTGATPAWVDTCSSATRAAAATCTSDDAEKACKTPPGTLADGAACGSSAQCKSSYCKKVSPAAETTNCGTCAATVAVGGACDAIKDRCASGSSCKTTGTSTTGTCTATTSTERVAEGGTCVSDTSFSSCASGLRCDFTSKKCVKLAASGDACTSSSDCQKTLACVEKKCGAKVAIGGSCVSSSDCVSGAGCDLTSKKCAAYTFGAPGEACDYGTKQCAKGSCLGASVGTGGPTPGKCPQIIADGQICDAKSETTRCDDYASCIGGKCQIFDPASCK
jgi:hypothetical protein